MGKQVAWAAVGMTWTFVVTLAIMFIINLIPGCKFRASDESEIVGMDETELGEYVADYAYLHRSLEDEGYQHPHFRRHYAPSRSRTRGANGNGNGPREASPRGQGEPQASFGTQIQVQSARGSPSASELEEYAGRSTVHHTQAPREARERGSSDEEKNVGLGEKQ
jgi:Amt family ammonium transporter